MKEFKKQKITRQNPKNENKKIGEIKKIKKKFEIFKTKRKKF